MIYSLRISLVYIIQKDLHDLDMEVCYENTNIRTDAANPPAGAPMGDTGAAL